MKARWLFVLMLWISDKRACNGSVDMPWHTWVLQGNPEQWQGASEPPEHAPQPDLECLSALVPKGLAPRTVHSAVVQEKNHTKWDFPISPGGKSSLGNSGRPVTSSGCDLSEAKAERTWKNQPAPHGCPPAISSAHPALRCPAANRKGELRAGWT